MGNSYQINIAAGASDVVYLTGLTLDGASTVNAAIYVDGAAAVTIRHCSIRDTVGNGVSVGFSEARRLLIEDTSLSNGNDNMNLEGRALVHRIVDQGASRGDRQPHRESPDDFRNLRSGEPRRRYSSSARSS